MSSGQMFSVGVKARMSIVTSGSSTKAAITQAAMSQGRAGLFDRD